MTTAPLTELSNEVFKGQELAARWWRAYHRRPFSRDEHEDEIPRHIQIAIDELVRYTCESMPGIERHLKPEHALEMGFIMGFTLHRALTNGEFDQEEDLPAPEREGPFGTLFSPKRPRDAH